MLYPSNEWQIIEAENSNSRTVFWQVVVPLLCLISVSSVVGSILFTSRIIFSFGYVVCRVAVLCSSLGVGILLSAFVMSEINIRQTGKKEYDRIFALIAYSSGAAFLVVMMVELFPFFNELLALALYSCYIYWRGISILKIADQQQIAFSIISLVVVIAVLMLLFFFFGNVLRAIII